MQREIPPGRIHFRDLERRIRIEGIGSGNAFLKIGQAVTIRIGVGIDSLRMKDLLPDVAHAVAVQIDIRWNARLRRWTSRHRATTGRVRARLRRGHRKDARNTGECDMTEQSTGRRDHLLGCKLHGDKEVPKNLKISGNSSS